MKTLKKKKKKKKNFFFFFFFEIGNFFSNWEKSHLNPIGKGAEFRPLRTPKKIPVDRRKNAKLLLTFCILETTKRVLLQTVKSQMKCPIMWHFIRVYTVCLGKKICQQINTFEKIITSHYNSLIYSIDNLKCIVSN